MGCEKGEKVFATGGAVKSKVWTQPRANVLQRKILVPEAPEASMGSAVIVALRTYFNGITYAVRSMVRIKEIFYPEPDKAKTYEDLYSLFVKECKKSGYL